jgi:hypothetical protein
LAAVDPWDVDGAKRAGLSAAWIDREAASYTGHLKSPDLICAGFEALGDTLGCRHRSLGMTSTSRDTSRSMSRCAYPLAPGVERVEVGQVLSSVTFLDRSE